MNINLKSFMVVCLIFLILITSLAWATDTTPSKTSVPTNPTFEKLTLGVVYYQDDPQLKAGITTMANSLGIDILESTTGGDFAKVLSEMETFVSKGVHAVIATTSATDEMRDVLSKAKSKGVKMVTVGNIPAPRLDVDSEVIMDDYDLAFISLKEAIYAMGGEGKLGIVGSIGSKAVQLRARVVQLMTDLYTLIKTFETGSTTDNEKAIVQRLYEELGVNKDVKAVWCTSSQFVPGTLEGLKKRELDNIPVFCAADGITTEDVKGLAADNMWQVIAYPDHVEAGRVAVRLATSAASGVKVQRYTYILANLLTKSEAKKLEEDAIPTSATSDIAWNDTIWSLYEKYDANGVADAKAAVEALKMSAVRGGEFKLPEPAELPVDFKIKHLTIGINMIGMSAWGELVLEGCEEIAKMFDVKLVYSNANNDFSQMAADMETLIARGVDGIYVMAGTTESMEPAVKKAVERGIKVVTFNNPQPNVPQVSAETAQDDYAHAFMGLRPALSYMGGKGKLGVAWIGASTALANRVRVMRMLLESYPDIIPIEFGERSANLVGDTMLKTESVLEAHPDIKAFWAAYDALAIGIHEALKQTNRTDIPIFSVDVSVEDIVRMSEIGSPWVLTATSDAREVGRVAMLYLIAACYDQRVSKYIRIPAFALTQEQARLVPTGTYPVPVASGYGWTPFLVALRNKIQQQ